ncbi:MAG: porin family protein [Chitinophagaceae bacterium]
MPENDFEKQVQQQMNELSFVPSAAVWPEVEKQIRRKKRRLLLWLPVLLVLLAGAGWWQMDGEQKDASNNALKIVAGEKSAGSSVKKTAYSGTQDSLQKENTGLKQQPVNEAAADKLLPASPLKNQIKKSIAGERTQDNQPVSKLFSSKHSGGKGDALANKKQAIARSINDGLNDDLPGKQGLATVEKIATKKVPVHKAPVKESNTVDQTEEAEGAITSMEAMDENNTKTGGTPLQDSIMFSEPRAVIKGAKDIAEKKKPAARKKKIEWGISVQAGSSNFSGGFSGVYSSAASYLDSRVIYSNSSAAPGNNLNNGSSNPGGATPSVVRPGFSFAAGAFVVKKIGKQANLLAGLHYHYYSTRINVGAKVNTNISSLEYRTGDAGTYTNRFHFIEIPVTIAQQLGKASRFSINAGVAASLLAGSQAVVYNAQNNSYQQGKTYINKVQVGLLAGIDYKFFPKSVPVLVGPQINYGISNIFTKDLYGSRHLFFAGIGAKIFFSKK